MEYLIQFLGGFFDDPETLQLAFVVAVAGGMFAFGLGLMLLLGGASSPLRRRLQDVSGNAPAKGGVSAETIARVLKPAAPYVLPKKDWERSKMSARLVHAGYRSPNALTSFYALKTLFALLLPVLVLLGASWFPEATVQKVMFAALAASFVGVTAPNVVLERRVGSRQRELRNAFPDALDLLVVCAEAGLGLNAALQRTARELVASHPALAEELALVNVEIRAGADRVEALKNLASRTGLDDIRGLVSLLAQSIRFGTGIAETLRIYAEEFRDKRMQRAEELAAKLGTKLIFPLVLCLFPSFFLVAIGPAVLRMIAAFSGR